MLNLNEMNEAQRSAVTHREGPLLLLAGPGSGKTYTITRRIQYLIQERKVPPEQILVITFTKEAAKSMQNRFQKESEGVCAVNFGTFHSVFYHILRESHVYNNPQFSSNKQKEVILSSVLSKYQSEKIAKEEVREVLSAISFYKNTKDIEAAKNSLQLKWQEHFPSVFQSYETARKRDGMLDFDDILYDCLKLLQKDKRCRAYWQSRFSHILIDEFQDINPVQYEIVKLLTKPPYSVFAVGDDDQAIYGFRGSKPACLKQYAEEFHARQLLLNVNYRSTPDIVKASLLVIGENQDRFSKKLVSAVLNEQVQKNSNVSITVCETAEEQYQKIICHIQMLYKITADKVSADTHTSTAVLFRTNSRMQRFAVELKKGGIPYVMKEKSDSVYEHFIARDINAYMQTACLCITSARTDELKINDRKHLLEVINKPPRNINREELAVGEISLAEKSPALRQLEKQLSYLKKAPFKQALIYLRKAMGYERYLRILAGGDTKKLGEWMEYLDWLCMDAVKYRNFQEWTEAQQFYAESLQQAEHTSKQAAIQLMTIHASKGLEFDRVFIPDCNEKVFPHGNMPSQAACEEERRIFYVGMTRAKKCLELFCIKGTEERPRLPSRFLNPLWKTYSSSKSSSNSDLSKNSSNASATASYTASSSIKDNSGSSFGSLGFSL